MPAPRASIIRDGTIKLDAGSLFGAMPKCNWESTVKVDRKNRINLGMNCLYVEMGGRKILVDTGIGSTHTEDLAYEHFGLIPSKLGKWLKTNGITPKEITDVILTHGHPDHAGGLVRRKREGALISTFPKATIYLQEAALEQALDPDERCIFPGELGAFDTVNNQLNLLNGDTEVFPGLNVFATDGHCHGHQIVMIQTGGERIVHLGDLVPTPYHLNLSVISAFDDDPIQTLDIKRHLIRESVKSGWLLVFGHGLPHAAGYLEERGDMTYLRCVQL